MKMAVYNIADIHVQLYHLNFVDMQETKRRTVAVLVILQLRLRIILVLNLYQQLVIAWHKLIHRECNTRHILVARDVESYLGVVPLLSKLREKADEVRLLVNRHYEYGEEVQSEPDEVDAGTWKTVAIRTLCAFQTTFTDVTGTTLVTVRPRASGRGIFRILR